MHILLIHQAFAALDEPGGTRHHELARFLIQKGHQVTVIASKVSYLTGDKAIPPRPPICYANRGGQADGGVKFCAPTPINALHKSFVHRVFAFLSFMVSSFLVGLSVRNVDVVWVHRRPFFQGVTAWALQGSKGRSFLFEVRDLWPDFAIAVGVLKNPTLIKLSLWLEGFLYRHADRMMVNSRGT